MGTLSAWAAPGLGTGRSWRPNVLKGNTSVGSSMETPEDQGRRDGSQDGQPVGTICPTKETCQPAYPPRPRLRVPGPPHTPGTQPRNATHPRPHQPQTEALASWPQPHPRGLSLSRECCAGHLHTGHRKRAQASPAGSFSQEESAAGTEQRTAARCAPLPARVPGGQRAGDELWPEYVGPTYGACPPGPDSPREAMPRGSFKKQVNRRHRIVSFWIRKGIFGFPKC